MDEIQQLKGNIFYNVTLSFWTNTTKPIGQKVVQKLNQRSEVTNTNGPQSKLDDDGNNKWITKTTETTKTTTNKNIDLVSTANNISSNLNWKVSHQLQDTHFQEEADGVVSKLSDNDYDYYGDIRHNVTNCSVWSNWTQSSGPTPLEDCLSYPIECLQFCLNNTSSDGNTNQSVDLPNQSDWLGHPDREYWALFLIILPILALFGNILVILR